MSPGQSVQHGNTQLSDKSRRMSRGKFSLAGKRPCQAKWRTALSIAIKVVRRARHAQQFALLLNAEAPMLRIDPFLKQLTFRTMQITNKTAPFAFHLAK